MNAFNKPAEYDRIEHLLNILAQSGTLERMAGNCVASADIVQNMLQDVGIPSMTVECKASFYRREGDNEHFFFVGYDSFYTTGGPNEVDTHVVVVTQTERPMLIDASVGHVLPGEQKYILEPLTSVDPTIMGEFMAGDMKVTYRVKDRIRMPSLHQKSLLARMLELRRMEQSLKVLRVICYVGLGASLLNMAANAALIAINLLNQ